VTPTAIQRERHPSLTSTPYIALQIKSRVVSLKMGSTETIGINKFNTTMNRTSYEYEVIEIM
jgi:hypothetical protein